MDMAASQGMTTNGKSSHLDLHARHRFHGSFGRPWGVVFSRHDDGWEVGREYDGEDLCPEDSELSASRGLARGEVGRGGYGSGGMEREG